jgi:hypothetical protein
MAKPPPDDLSRTLREHGDVFAFGADHIACAVLLTIPEYEHYLDLLDDEADGQDAELAARLKLAAAQPAEEERVSFRDYLRQRGTSGGPVQG